MATSIDSVLFTSKTYSNGEHPIAIRITKDRKTKYHFLGYTCPKDFWDAASGFPKKKYIHKTILDVILSKKLAQAKDLVMQYDIDEKHYEASDIIEELNSNKKAGTLFDLYEVMISRMTESKRIGNANAYKDSLRAIKAYTENKDLKLKEVTHSFLTGFETHHLKKGNKKNTIGAYLRILRAVINEAIKVGYLKEADYPFKNFKLGRLKNTPEHRAIKLEQIRLIEALELPVYSKQWLAKAIFLFSYYNQGINFIDIANLKWEVNTLEGRLNYVRSKTKDRFSIKLNDRSKEILTHLDAIRVDNYVFPILNEVRHITEIQKNNRLKKVIKQVNINLREIATACEITGTNLTTYVSRHTYATVLKRAGVSTVVISESLGHETESITQHYLDSFESTVIDEANEHL